MKTNIEKKPYEKATMQVIEIKSEGMLCFSYGQGEGTGGGGSLPSELDPDNQ